MSDTQPEELIEVRITASQELHYNQTKKIPRSLWEKYQRMVDKNADDDEFLRAFDHLIDDLNPDDYGEFEDLEMSLVKRTA